MTTVITYHTAKLSPMITDVTYRIVKQSPITPVIIYHTVQKVTYDYNYYLPYS